MTSERAQYRRVASRQLFKETPAIGILPMHHQGFCSVERHGLELRLGQSRRATPRMCYFTGGVTIWNKSTYSRHQEESVFSSTGSSLVYAPSPCHSDLSAIPTQSIMHKLWSNKLALAFLALSDASRATTYFSSPWMAWQYWDTSTYHSRA